MQRKKTKLLGWMAS